MLRTNCFRGTCLACTYLAHHDLESFIIITNDIVMWHTPAHKGTHHIDLMTWVQVLVLPQNVLEYLLALKCSWL